MYIRIYMYIYIFHTEGRIKKDNFPKWLGSKELSYGNQ